MPKVKPHRPLNPEVTTDGSTVWVNAPLCIGRFCRFSVEIGAHNEHGWAPNGGTTKQDWDRFVFKMKELYNVVVAKRYMPEYFRE